MELQFHNLDKARQEAMIAKLAEELSPRRWELMQKVVNERTRHLSIILEDIYQAHNAGAVVRSCDAFGIQDIHVIEIKNKLKLAQTTVSRGATKWMDVHYYRENGANNTKQCFDHLHQKGFCIAALALSKETTTLEDIPLDKPIALALGTEMKGLSEEACELADYCVRLPMYGFTESFNLSVCGALSLQTLRKRLEASNIDWKLKEDEKRVLLFDWIKRCIKYWDRLV